MDDLRTIECVYITVDDYSVIRLDWQIRYRIRSVKAFIANIDKQSYYLKLLQTTLDIVTLYLVTICSSHINFHFP